MIESIVMFARLDAVQCTYYITGGTAAAVPPP